LSYFEDIAIIGYSCVFPGALNADDLWENVKKNICSITDVPEGYWRIDPDTILINPFEGYKPGYAWTKKGGYVTGFNNIFNPDGFALESDFIKELDPLFLWLLHTGREALIHAGFDAVKLNNNINIGAIFGNLSYPSHFMQEFGENKFLDKMEEDFILSNTKEMIDIKKVHPINRFMSGLPAFILAKALNLKGVSYALDAACSSSLYAIKYACDALFDKKTDVMLAGGINRADDLIVHTGFCNIQATSRTGRSLPFFKAADGLIPAEGAGFLVLMRLNDAIKENKKIYGVIKGIGLSNDGRGHGLLVPSKEGQTKAMLKAYEIAKIDPSGVDFVECHATGTPVGDNMEVEAMKEVFKNHPVYIASLKSNIGHAITASGAAATIKVLKAFENNLMPATLGEGDLLDEFKGSALNVLRENKNWETKNSKKAGISNFGFGGNNAHMILEEFKKDSFKVSINKGQKIQNKDIAIVGLGVVAANVTSLEDFIISLFNGESFLTEVNKGELMGLCKQIDLPFFEIKFPPNDLKQTLPQQLMLLKTAREALRGLKKYNKERTGIFAGMQTDCTGINFGIACRFIDWANRWSQIIDCEDLDINKWVEDTRNKICPYQTVAGGLGIIPNNVANRISNQYDFRESSFTISNEELSGYRVLDIAIRALRAKELDTALAGAVDVCCNTYHVEAARSVLDKNKHIPGDIAITLVLKRLEDAKKDGDKIYSIITDRIKRKADIVIDSEGSNNFVNYYGYSHVASGLLNVLAATLICNYKSMPSFKGKRAVPFLSSGNPLLAEVKFSALYNGKKSIRVKEDEKAVPEGLFIDRLPDIYIFKGANRSEVKEYLTDFKQNSDGEAKLVLLIFGKEYLDEAKKVAVELLEKGQKNISFSNNKYGIYYYDKPINGEVAFVFAGAAGVYKGMCSEIFMAYPFIKEGMCDLFPDINNAIGWIYNDDITPNAEQILWGATFASQIHAWITRNQLNIKPQAAIGYSSGESNSLVALGAWTDVDRMYYEFRDAQVLTKHVGGDFEVIKKAWKDKGIKNIKWTNYWIMAPAEAVQKEIGDKDLVHISIINSPDDVVISGQEEVCEEIVKKFGAHRSIKLPYNVANHCPEVNFYANEWRKFHYRQTDPINDIRFYTSSTCGYYYPTAEKAADALVGMATRTLNFPKMIENAHKDGVRIFIEHGPRDACTKWIGRILEGKEYIAVPLDKYGRSSIVQIFHAVAELIAAGLQLSYKDFFRYINGIDLLSRKEVLDPKRTLTIDVYIDKPVLPKIEDYVKVKNQEWIFEEVTLKDTVEDESVIMKRAPRLANIQEPEKIIKRLRLEPDKVAINDNSIVGQLLKQNEYIADLHKKFIQRQKSLFENFINYRNHSVALLLNALKKGNIDVINKDINKKSQQLSSQKSDKIKNDIKHSSFKDKSFKDIVTLKKPEKLLSSRLDIKEKVVSKKMTKEDLKKFIFKPLEIKEPVGPKFNKEQLMIHACGNISEIYGPKFKEQDKYDLQVRMPMPPLLLADRVTGIDAEQFVLGSGRMWTETDIKEDAWYVTDGYIPPGIIIESGQADLMLTSWQGIDVLNNKGNRVYRLLGAEGMYYGKPPKIGDTLCFQIEILNYVTFGEIKIFNFQYDCRVNGELRLSARNAQAGFFTYDEIANSGGVLWSPEKAEFTENPRLDPPVVLCKKSSFNDDEINALAEGDIYRCFGEGFEMAAHARTPAIAKGRMKLVDRVTLFDLKGGPFKRGYIRAEHDVTPDKWYLDCHFYKDPCMPGTLMADASLQVMAIYMVGLGFTLDKSGWHFEPVSEVPYKLLARGQVTKEKVKLIYEVFVEEVINDEVPTIYADVLGSTDKGLKIFYGQRLGLKLIPD
jgi:acyl transferase domain-containing protein/3-hydroxymyristoyl/3-hydroxydecanoyl-(acyl carrier protein) dehydratase